MVGSDDENPPPPTPTQQAPHTVSTIKLPILKKGEYDIWAMKMEHYLSHTDYPIWEVMQKGNGHVSVSTDTNRVIKVLPPNSDEEEKLIKKMNEKATGEDTSNKEKVLEEPDSTKVEVKKEGNTESTRKRPGRRLKIKATKKSKRQKTDSDLEEEEQLKAFLMIVPDEEGEINYEVLNR
ncbi:hypothetical protein Tco_0957936, partial [Tanacetum coccineum]